MIVQIPARDLVPGDIVRLGSTRYTLVLSKPLDFDPNNVALHFVELGQPMRGPVPSPWAGAAMFNVERPDPLTPAQQHAEDLLVIVREVTGGLPLNLFKAQDLLAKIDPPKPPTLEEALAALRYLRQQALKTDLPTSNDALQKADALLARVPK